MRGDGQAGLASRLYNGETSFDFVGRWRRWFIFSAVVISAGLVSLLTQGLNYGIEFKGGNAWQVEAPGVSVGEARDALRSVDLGDAKIQIQGNDVVRVQHSPLPPERQAEVRQKLADLAKVDISQVSVNDVGPSWGKSVTAKARTALIVFFVLITLYISLRFEWKMAMAAISAVVHDILVTVGVYSISRFEVTPATVVAFLTILGYSLYDTIVVFDKVQENTRGLSASGRMTYSDTVNLSMNQVLMRSLNTSLVAILPILSVLVVGAYGLGATTLKDFGLALLVGLLTGAYSSIFIAAPILAMLKEREPRYTNIRLRLQSKGGSGPPLTPAAAAALSGTGSRGGRGGGGRDRTGSQRRPGSAPAPAEDQDLFLSDLESDPTEEVRAGTARGAGSGSASGTGPARGPAGGRPRPVNRPAPRPRKKGKKR